MRHSLRGRVLRQCLPCRGSPRCGHAASSATATSSPGSFPLSSGAACDARQSTAPTLPRPVRWWPATDPGSPAVGSVALANPRELLVGAAVVQLSVGALPVQGLRQPCPAAECRRARRAPQRGWVPQPGHLRRRHRCRHPSPGGREPPLRRPSPRGPARALAPQRLMGRRQRAPVARRLWRGPLPAWSEAALLSPQVSQTARRRAFASRSRRAAPLPGWARWSSASARWALTARAAQAGPDAVPCRRRRWRGPTSLAQRRGVLVLMEGRSLQSFHCRRFQSCCLQLH
mmetsp:Transcript_60190/g.166590  ORF Transcript_60190/g.166590 Transcript_60190/m.166590 type:complete len:287 (+) Transcript_60190:649-1509(+)